ncbi:MAG: cytidine deaminase [Verrucomicrobiales bacterium]|nr:cytidine deaminase [Verrucomicrobiales bacterium]
MSETEIRTDRGIWIPIGEPPNSLYRETFDELMAAAREVKERAYAPYSGFKVGSAALIDDKVSVGSNVENASYGGTMCAERTAIFTGISTGGRQLQAIAISTDAFEQPEIEARSPCGFCRQVISEFADSHTVILLDSGRRGDFLFSGEAILIDTLLPWRFELGIGDS